MTCGLVDNYQRFGRTNASNFIVERSTLLYFENGRKLMSKIPGLSHVVRFLQYVSQPSDHGGEAYHLTVVVLRPL
jgi:hypothetical protein